jgi:hypothetical protein
MKANCDHKNPLQRDGVSQSDRMLAALADDFAKVDERSVEALMAYAYNYAEHVRFFEDENHQTAAGNWQPLFEVTYRKRTSKPSRRSANNEPHLALFLCFLHLMQYPQKALNRLPKRHLDFYYQKVLQLQKKKPQADTVHLVFELAKNAKEQFVKKGTQFDAKKDANGVPRIYEAVEDAVLNTAKVTHLRSVLQKKDRLFFASVANSADGLGEELPKSMPSWSAFGHDQLPRAAVGFALASPVLLLREGKRTINLTLKLSAKVTIATDDLIDQISMYGSGEKEWIGPFAPNNQTKANGDELVLNFEIPSDQPGILPYNPNVLSGEFNTLLPLIRLTIEPKENTNLYETLRKVRLESALIGVNVTGVKNIAIENDLGAVNTNKPFQPFGPVPKVGSNMYIGSDEIFQKDLTSLKLNFSWQSPPEKFSTHYSGYKDFSVKSNSDFYAHSYIWDNGDWVEKDPATLFASNAGDLQVEDVFEKETSWEGLHSLFRYPFRVMQLPYVRPIQPLSFVPLFERGIQRVARLPFRIQRRRFRHLKIATPQDLKVQRQRNGFLKLQLMKAFGHAEYPTSYTLAIAARVKTQGDTTVIPNEPYTPVLESLSLDYVAATETVKFNKEAANATSFEDRQIQFFHLEPFGQAERHPFLNTQLPYVSQRTTRLLPVFPHNRTLLYRTGRRTTATDHPTALSGAGR